MPYLQTPDLPLDQKVQFYLDIISKDPTKGEAFYDLAELICQHSGDMFNEQAMELWNHALTHTPEWRERYPEWTYALRRLGGYFMSKRDNLGEGDRCIQDAVETELAIASKNPLSKYGFRILSTNNNPQHIGHAAIETDLFVKLGMLGWREAFDGVLLVPDKVANPCLLDYWRKYVNVVDDKATAAQLMPMRHRLWFDTWYVKLPDGKVRNAFAAMGHVQREWERQGRKPLLQLSSQDQEKGWSTLEKAGMPAGSWFVSLHVREPGYYGENKNSQTGMYRNADVQNYLSAIEEITAQGGWVVRVGDSSMTPLPPMKNTIDYATSDFKSDWMDVFLCSQCKYFFGTNSGLMLVACVFGVPTYCANWTPMSAPPYGSTDTFIPKMYWNEREQRFLTWEEGFLPPVCWGDFLRLQELGIKVLENSPDEIVDLAKEMLEDAGGKRNFTPQDDLLQEKMHALMNSPFSYGEGTSSRVGRAFLRKYQHLFRN